MTQSVRHIIEPENIRFRAAAMVYRVWQEINIKVFFGFCKKLVCVETQPGTYKASKNIWRTVYLQVFILKVHLKCKKIFSFILSSLNFLTICANFPFCLRQWQSKMTPWFGQSCKIILSFGPSTSKQGQYDDNDLPCRSRPLCRPPHLWGCIRHRTSPPPTKTPHQ